MNCKPADELLLQLGDRLGLPGLCLDRAGACQLLIDRQWQVRILLHPAGDRLVATCPVGAPDVLEEVGPEVLRVMLQANFMGCGTQGGVLSIAPGLGVCLEHEVYLPEASAQRLEQVLERLLKGAQAWRQRLLDSPRRAPVARRPSSGLVGQRA